MSVSSIRPLALGLAFVAVGFTASANAACERAGGWGIGVTKDIASFMSEKATHQAMDKDGVKPVGRIVTTCNNDAVLYFQCHSTVQACK
jgi:hypothetical protein